MVARDTLTMDRLLSVYQGMQMSGQMGTPLEGICFNHPWDVRKRHPKAPRVLLRGLAVHSHTSQVSPLPSVPRGDGPWHRT